MITYPFHDIEIEEVTAEGASLVKILAQDGRRFTYLVRSELDSGAVEFVLRMLDGGVQSNLVIERTNEGVFRAEETRQPLPRHG